MPKKYLLNGAQKLKKFLAFLFFNINISIISLLSLFAIKFNLNGTFVAQMRYKKFRGGKNWLMA